MALFLLGAVGGTAVVMASNATLFSGAPDGVVTLFTVGVVSVAAVAIMLYFIPRRAVAPVPMLMVIKISVTVKNSIGRWLTKLVKKLGRRF